MPALLEEIEETVTDEKGKEKKVKKSIEVADPNASGYVKYFTRSNPYWEELVRKIYFLNIKFHVVVSIRVIQIINPANYHAGLTVVKPEHVIDIVPATVL